MKSTKHNSFVAKWKGRGEIVVSGRDYNGCLVTGSVTRDGNRYQIDWTRYYDDGDLFDADNQDWGTERDCHTVAEAMELLCQLMNGDPVAVPSIPDEWRERLKTQVYGNIMKWEFDGTKEARDALAESVSSSSIYDDWGLSSVAYNTSEEWGLLNIDWEEIGDYWTEQQRE